MATQISFRNPSVTNSVKMVMQDAVMVKDPKDDKAPPKFNGQWRSVPTYSIVKPNENGTAYVGPGRRVIIEEMPT
jgi:hypothetical protein